jgi:hypothetical protein
MFRWYRDAQVCYAYLSDVPKAEEDHWSPDSAFRQSKWFTRGWTLQELLAPAIAIFYDKNWAELGTKSCLENLLTSITGVEAFCNYQEACIAQKMSWASRRVTTRVEDIAYCLLGLFDVNMPTIYGEGEKAFMRLQLEIIKQSDDESIFAWTDKDLEGSHQYTRSGLLASSPSSFQDSGDVTLVAPNHSTFHAPFTMTNKGLRIQLILNPLRWDNDTHSTMTAKVHKLDLFPGTFNYEMNTSLIVQSSLA